MSRMPRLGNGGLGRLAACFMESMATVGCPAYGYGIRYEHGLFRQRFANGQQAEVPEDWLTAGASRGNLSAPKAAYTIRLQGPRSRPSGTAVKSLGAGRNGDLAQAYDTPVIGWQGKWANTLRLWAAKPTTLVRSGTVQPGRLCRRGRARGPGAHALSRVLYPDDTTYQGKELRLKQEFFLTSAALQDILRRFKAGHAICATCPKFVAIQMNDTHPAIAGPELVRLLVDENGMTFDRCPRNGARVSGLHQPHPFARGAGALGDLYLWHHSAAPHADRRTDRQLAPPHLPARAALHRHRQASRSADGRAGLCHGAQGERGFGAAFSDLVKQNALPGAEQAASGAHHQPDQWRDAAPLVENGQPALVRPDHRHHRTGLGG